MSETRPQMIPGLPPGIELPTPPATPVSRPHRASGVTPEVIIVATVLALPAFYTSVVLGELPIHVVLERYLVVIFGVLMISEPLYWFGVGGRLAAPRDFVPEEGHRVPRRAVIEPSDVRHAGGFDDAGFAATDVDDWGAPLFDDGGLGAPAFDAPAFDENDFNAPGELGQPFEAVAPFDAPQPVIDEVFGRIEFDDPADLARPSFD